MVLLGGAHFRTCLSHLVLYALIGSCACMPCWGQEEQITAKGQIAVSTRVGPNELARTNQLGFEVTIGNSAFRIRCEVPEAVTNYAEYVFDGTNMHILYHLEKTRRPGSDTPELTHTFPAWIEQRQIPPNDGWRAQYIWLAYASHGLLPGITNSMLRPLWYPDDPALRSPPFEMPVYITLLTNEVFRLPQSVEFLNDGTYRSYNPATRKTDILALRFPYRSGFTNAIYRVLECTNFYGAVLPVRWVFTAYSTPLGKGESPFERIVIEGSAREFMLAEPKAPWNPRF